MSDARQIEADIYERLSKVIDPELGRSVTDLGMIAAIEAAPASSDAGTYDVTVHVELTVPGCPLSETITSQINGAVSSYPGAQLLPHIEVGSMSRDKLADLVADLKAERKQNPFSKPGVKTRIFAIASSASPRLPRTWPPRLRPSASTRPPSTRTFMASHCRACSACIHSPPI